MKIAVTGKGGVGKTTFAATLARLYAQEGKHVLAADVDPDANLGLALGFSEEDLELLWDAIINMFEHDHSAARGKMAVRKLIIFKHSKELGDCPAYKLFDAVEVKKQDEAAYPRKYQDYEITIHRDQIPESVEVIEKC